MAIWQIKGAKGSIRYRARMVGTFPGKRLNATFETREEAEQWVARSSNSVLRCARTKPVGIDLIGSMRSCWLLLNVSTPLGPCFRKPSNWTGLTVRLARKRGVKSLSNGWFHHANQ